MPKFHRPVWCVLGVFVSGIVCWLIGSNPLGLGLTAWAETRVAGPIAVDTVWSAADSPYLLTGNVMVSSGHTLVVGPGVRIASAPEVVRFAESPGIYITNGQLLINGSREARVTIDNIPGIYVHATAAGLSRAQISRADFVNGSNLSFLNAVGTVATSTFVGGSRGVSVDHSQVSIWGSRLTNHYFTGLYVAAGSDQAVAVSGSDLSGNMMYALYNAGSTPVSASQNWWGDTAGPMAARKQLQDGAAVFEPWLGLPPEFDPPESAEPPEVSACCSSVLFLPGLEGTRLYQATGRLWEPLSSADLTALRLSPEGLSLEPDIYAGEPIRKFLGLVGVYDHWSNFLDELVRQGLIKEWQPFGYDWRQAVTEVVSQEVKRATSTDLLLNVVETLAERSQTGRVTIVAHSNGGLVAQALGRLLAERGLTNLVDKVIDVGVPILGTPAALAALLHGYGQSIASGWIARESDARRLAGNMPSAYGLLPAEKFFLRTTLGPIVKFASSSPIVTWLGWGVPPLPSISTAPDLRKFIGNLDGTRVSPWSFDTTKPIIGNAQLLEQARAFHDWADSFVWPEPIEVWSIVGWHQPTPFAISYTPYGYRVDQTMAGDGVVVAPSAAAAGGEVVSIDLSGLTSLEGQHFDHASLLESATVESLIEEIITTARDDQASFDSNYDDTTVQLGELDWEAVHAAGVASRRELRITTHSPVLLDVYDETGNHTGLTTPPGDFVSYESAIPESLFERLGCIDQEALDCQYAVTVPDNGRAYKVLVTGTKRGVFTLVIERWHGADLVESIEWRGRPIFGGASAVTTLNSFSVDSSSSPSLLESTSPLGFDLNQDGTAETYSPATTTDDSVGVTNPPVAATTTDPWLEACQIAFPQ